jgi:hypothetical protein
MRRIGVLMGFPESDSQAQSYIAAFRDGLQKLGWTDGRNVQIDTRWATADVDRSIARMVKENDILVSLTGTKYKWDYGFFLLKLVARQACRRSDIRAQEEQTKMPKEKLGTGNKRAVLQRPATSYTSPRAIELQQRRAAALDYRLQGHAYHRIAKVLGCHPSTAHDYVVKALRDMIPREKAEAVLQLEMARLDAMQDAIFANAAKGDIPSIDACLRIIHQRARLLGLYPSDKHYSPLHMSVGGPDAPNAEDVGIQISFVKPTWKEHPDGSLWRDGEMIQPPDPPPPEPKLLPEPQPAAFGPNVLKFDRC